MKTNLLLEYLRRDDGVLLARFGDARLVKMLNGKIELRDGSPDDQAAAKEWCSLFLHDAVLHCRDRPARHI